MSLVAPSRIMLAAAAVGLLYVGAVQAQQQQGRRQGGFRGFQSNPGQTKLEILQNESVQKELELADDQKADLKKISENSEAKRRALFTGGGGQNFRDLSDAERQKRFAEFNTKREAITKEAVAKMGDVLLPHQAERLQEVYVQVRGPSVLTDDDEISKKLAVTEEQKEKLQEIRREAFSSLRPQGGDQGNARPQGGQGGFDPARMAAMRKEREEKSMAVLNATQKEQYTKMKGAPFAEAGNIRVGFGGNFGGRQGGQRRPNNNNNN